MNCIGRLARARFFHDRGCEYCHAIDGRGGRRGLYLSTVADRLNDRQITLRILNGGYNMPVFAGSLKPEDLKALAAFLNTRKQ